MKLHAIAAMVAAASLVTGCTPQQLEALTTPTPTVTQTATTAPTTAAATQTAIAAPTTAAPTTAAPSPTESPTPQPTVKTPEPTPVPTPVATPVPTPVPTPQPTPTPTPTAAPTCGVASTANPPVAPATTLGFYGKVTDRCTGKPLANVCITVGVPGAFCWAKTDSNGNYQIDMAAVSASPGQFELYFILQPYAVDHSVKQQVSSVVRIDFAMHP